MRPTIGLLTRCINTSNSSRKILRSRKPAGASRKGTCDCGVGEERKKASPQMLAR